MNGRFELAAFAVALCILNPFSQTVSANQEIGNFHQFAVEGRDKPFDMDCATKHAKYLPLAVEGQDAPMELASISGESGGFTHRQGLNRSSYSSETVTYSAPAVELITDEGREVNLAEYLATDRPVMLNFIFTTCTTICPVLSASFKQVQDLMGEEAEEVLMVSITIDPEYDTPEKLAEYAERFSAGSQWKFLTGQIDDVIAVEKAFDIFRGSKTNHEPVTFLRSGNSAEWLRIEGFANAGEIVAEYRKMISAQGG